MRTSAEGFQQCFNAQVAVDGGSQMILADAGYCNEEELAGLEERGIMAHVALGREGRKLAEIDGERRPATRWMAGSRRRWVSAASASGAWRR